MKPSLRLFKVLATVRWREARGQAPRIDVGDPFAETVTRWRVMPGDIDLFGHMNNSRYLLLMDFGRVDYLATAGLLPVALRDRWVIPVGSARVDFHGGLRPFEEFEIGTEVVSWNDRWFYMRQTFRTVGDNPRTVATGYVKTLCRARTGVIPPKEIVRRTLGIDLEAPELSDDLRVRFGVPSADHVPVVVESR